VLSSLVTVSPDDAPLAIWPVSVGLLRVTRSVPEPNVIESAPLPAVILSFPEVPVIVSTPPVPVMFVVKVSVPDRPDKLTVMPVEVAATVRPDTSTLTVSEPAPVLPLTVMEVVVVAPFTVKVSHAILPLRLIVSAVEPVEALPDVVDAAEALIV